MARSPRYLMVPTRRNRSPLRFLPWLLALVGWAGVVALTMDDIPFLSPATRSVQQGEDGTGTPRDGEPRADEGLDEEGPGQSWPSPVAVEVDLIHPAYPLALAGDPGWDYHKTLKVDLTGDGREETVHLIAQVDRTRRSDRDEFAWDDGHVWQLYVEEEGHVTHLFSQWVQIGEIRAAAVDPLLAPDRRGLLLLSLEGAGVGVYRLDYRGPGDFTTFELMQVPILAEVGPAGPR